MAGKLLRVAGPAGAGKSAVAVGHLRDGGADVLIDTTALWAAVRQVGRGPDGRYPERLDTDPALPLLAWAKTALTREALRRGLRVLKTSSTRADRDRDRALAADMGAEFAEEIVDPGEDVVRARLADDDGTVSPACQAAVDRWFR